MRANLVIVVLLGVAVAVAACNDTTAPAKAPAAHIATIANINVTAHAGTGDTVKISFNYYPPSCDTGAVFQARQTSDGLRFTVTSWASNLPCALLATTDYMIPPAVGYIVNPPHMSPLRLVFTQPGATDSVRVVGP